MDDQIDQAQTPAGDAPEGQDTPRRKRRRRRRRRGGAHDAQQQTTQEDRSGGADSPERPDGAGHEGGASGERAPAGKKRRRRRRKRSADTTAEAGGEPMPRRRRLIPTPEIESDPELFAVDMAFADLGLREEIVRALDEMGFKHPTHIQARLIPPMLAGHDVLGQAKTGTGKTAAFGIPLLQRAEKGTPFQGLVLCPTRELAIQIRDEMREIGRHTGIRVTAVYGGQRMQQQIRELDQGPELIVGTPGRVMDMAQRGHLRLDQLRMAVLDEVDRMLDIGFREDIRRILRQIPRERQTAMVSATLSPEIEDLARRYMQNPDKIVTTSGSLTVKMIKQRYFTVEAWDKMRLLHHLLTHEEPALTLVFCRLKRTVDELDAYLRRHGIESHAIHGDMRQSRRESVIRKLRSGKLEVLIASDVAARGLDVEGITHVINYDLPEDPDLYVHRIGRTARAGRDGIAWSFVTPAQGKLLTHIEQLIDAEIPKMEYPDFEPTERPAGFRDDTPTSPVIHIDAPPPVNRLAGPSIPVIDVRDEREKKKLEQKFPGGIVPTKLPPKRMYGRLTRGR